MVDSVRVAGIKNRLSVLDLEFVAPHHGKYTCVCGRGGVKGLKFRDKVTKEEVILGNRCARNYLPPEILPKKRKGKRVTFSSAFKDSWENYSEVEIEMEANAEG